MSDSTATLTVRQRFLSQRARLLIEAVHGLEAAATYCRAGKTQLGEYQSLNNRAFMPIDVVEDLEEVAGDPLVTRQLAMRQGYALVKLPPAIGAETVWGQRAARLLKEGGDILTAFGRAMENDGDIDPTEAAAMLADADELVAIAVEIHAALKRRAEGQY